MPVLPAGSDHRSKAEKTLGLRLAAERLKRLRRQNERLRIELKREKGDLVSFEAIKRQVLAANTSVKNQIFAVIERADYLPREHRLQLKREMIQALTDLAYERGVPRPDNE
jgi:hypothetical protein